VLHVTAYAVPSAIIKVALWPLAKLAAVGVRLAPKVHVWIVPLAGLMSTEPPSVMANTVSVKPVNVGVVNDGLAERTTEPVPVEDVTPVPPFATATVPVTFAAVPVVFWFNVGMSAATRVRKVGTPDEPLGAARTVLAVWLAKLEAATDKVPPSVRLPLVVIVPLKDRPLTDPVPPTLVTVPVLLVYPAGLDDAYAPKFDKAVLVLVAPVPPFATATVPVTFEAVPVVFWFSVGMSAATMARKVGTPAEPLGAAKTKLAVLLA